VQALAERPDAAKARERVVHDRPGTGFRALSRKAGSGLGLPGFLRRRSRPCARRLVGSRAAPNLSGGVAMGEAGAHPFAGSIAGDIRGVAHAVAAVAAEQRAEKPQFCGDLVADDASTPPYEPARAAALEAVGHHPETEGPLRMLALLHFGRKNRIPLSENDSCSIPGRAD